MDIEKVLVKSEASRNRIKVLENVTQVKETSNIEEVAQLLSTGEWIAICATPDEPYLFSIGKIFG